MCDNLVGVTMSLTCIQVRNSLEPVVIGTSREWVVAMRAHTNTGGYFVAGAKSGTLQRSRALIHLRRVRVLHFQGLRPGAFGGYGDPRGKDAAMDKALKPVWKTEWYRRYVIC